MLALCAFLVVQAPQLPQRQLVPELRISATGVNDPQFIGAVIESHGRILLADPRSGAIFQYDPQGHPLPRLGGSGEGPGEFRSPGALGLRGDSIWVWDAQQHRMLLFDGAGRSLRTTTMTTAAYGVGTLLNDGTIAVIPGWSSSRARPDAPPLLPVLHFTGAGSLRDTLFGLEVERGQMRMDVGNGDFIIGAQPFGDAPLLVGALGGDGFVRVDRRTTGEPVVLVTRFASDGRTRWTHRIPFTGAPVDPALIDSVVRRFTTASTPGMPGLPEANVRRAIAIPPRDVEVRSVALAPDGTVWLRRSTGAKMAARFTVLASNGAPAFEVELPPGAKLVGFGEGTIYLGSLDADELPVLTRYRVK